MKNNEKLYVCRHCGNIVEKLVDGGGQLVCCGEKMQELEPGIIEASREKHIPVAKIEGNRVIVNVGSIDHPMSAEHSILWIYLVSNKGRYLRHLDVNEAPRAEFLLGEDEAAVRVYAYCNLHGLWLRNIGRED